MALVNSIIRLVDIFGWTAGPDHSKNALPRDPQVVIIDLVDHSRERYDQFMNVISTATRGMPGSERLQRHAANIVDLAQRAREAPYTNFMPDIAKGLLQIMDEVLLYSEYEASHFIFRLTWNMEKEATALEGKMEALRVLLEAELEWKRREECGP